MKKKRKSERELLKEMEHSLLISAHGAGRKKKYKQVFLSFFQFPQLAIEWVRFKMIHSLKLFI